MTTDPAEKWKARALELLPKARFDNEVRLGYTGEDDQTIISIKVCSLRVSITAALAEAAAAGRENALTEVVSRVAERDYDAAKIVSEIVVAIRAREQSHD